MKLLRNKYGDQMRNIWNAHVIVLHGSQTSQQQRLAFKLSAPGEWKIVLATNIAETSVTVPDVTHVVDSGLVKEIRYEPSCNLSSLKEVPISQSSAKQRAGRAGRVRPGHCWRLYSQKYHDSNSAQLDNNLHKPSPNVNESANCIAASILSNNVPICAMHKYSIPEIKRIPLEEIILQVLLLKLGHPVSFLTSCLESPSEGQLQKAIENLIKFGAIYPNANSLPLTALGTYLAKLPVDIHIGKMLIMGSLFKCVEPVLTLAAALCSSSKTGNPFLYPMHNKAEAYNAHKRFSTDNICRYIGGDYSDHIASINAYEEWDTLSNSSAQSSSTVVHANFNVCKFYGSINGCNKGSACRFSHAASAVINSSTNVESQYEFCNRFYLNHAVLKEMKALRLYFRNQLISIGFIEGDVEKEDVYERDNDILLNCDDLAVDVEVSFTNNKLIGFKERKVYNFSVACCNVNIFDFI